MPTWSIQTNRHRRTWQRKAVRSTPITTNTSLTSQSSESPSIYVFFPSISANDGCTQVGNTYSSTMTSFAPGQLSTIAAPGVTKVFDFENLACGAKPLIAPPSFLFNLDPAFHDCIPGLSQGVDPPTAVPAGGADSTPVGRFKRAQAHARAEGWAPRQTPAPT